jgi:2-haloacid dehalogenase
MIDREQYDTITFDCYGTLVDWETGIVAALAPVLRRAGVRMDGPNILTAYAELEAKFESQEYRPYREVLVEVVRSLGRRYGFQPTEEEQTCLVSSLPAWKPFPDTREALEALGGAFDLAVISNVDDDLFAHTRRALGVDFTRVITAQQARAYKPDRKVFDYALLALDTPASRILHVAQSMYHDINVAHAMGMGTVWVDRSAGKRGAGATLPAAGQADRVVPDLETLVTLLL